MKTLKKISALFLVVAATLLTGCNEDKTDSDAYFGHWKNVKYPNVVLEITNEKDNKVIIAKTDLKERKRPVRKEPASIKDGILMYGDIYPIVIQKDGTLVYQGDTFIKQSDEEIANTKKVLATPQVQVDPFGK